MKKLITICLLIGLLVALGTQRATAQQRGGQRSQPAALTDAERDWVTLVRIDEKLARRGTGLVVEPKGRAVRFCDDVRTTCRGRPFRRAYARNTTSHFPECPGRASRIRWRRRSLT